MCFFATQFRYLMKFFIGKLFFLFFLLKTRWSPCDVAWPQTFEVLYLGARHLPGTQN